ncbi:hypothetical protein [Treponema sp. R80B11-R83G3]
MNLMFNRKNKFGNINAYILILSIAFISIVLSACFTTPSSEASDKVVNKGSNEQSNVRTARTPKMPFTGDGGKGITIAVPTPSLNSTSISDNWLPQFFQDRMTGDISKYSAMTVLDRSNEKLVLAEQSLSLSGNYSDNDYIKIGNLTNAKYIVAGKIQNISGRYNISFRINNTETNEIKAAFDKSYLLNDIESGLATKEAVRELLVGMGIELTDEGERSLLAVQEIDVRATAQLARGTAAAKAGNEVEALAFFTEALNSNTTKTEADRNIQNVFTVPTGASIRERANYAQTHIDKWKKIFTELNAYLDKNFLIVVYDFSVIEDKIDMSGAGSVSITVKPGVKLVPNRTALLVYKKILDEWELVRTNAENKSWVNVVKIPKVFGRHMNSPYDYAGISYIIRLGFGLYDDFGDRINKIQRQLSVYLKSTDQIIAQQKYYENAAFRNISFNNIPLKDITDTLTPKIEGIVWEQISNPQNITGFVLPVMSVAEYLQWQSTQGNTR